MSSEDSRKLELFLFGLVNSFGNFQPVYQSEASVAQILSCFLQPRETEIKNRKQWCRPQGHH